MGLVKSRRGQGIYRKNLEGFEDKCRVTGIANPRHLRASHIIPWRFSSDFEKLDGNNGLLLSPHVDHLFDQGYISFEDTGRMIVSEELSADILSKWAIDAKKDYAPFRTEQIPYIAFHREFILKDNR